MTLEVSNDWPIDSQGIWRQYLVAGDQGPLSDTPILFLDRDGVLVEEVHYLHRVEDLRIYPAAARLVSLANAQAWRVVIVTNQAGIGRGLYGWREFEAVNAHLLDRLAAEGARVDAVLATPHHAEGIGSLKVADHPMRKPRPGMLLDAIAHFSADATACVVVGDRATDLEAGRAAGLRRGVLVQTGYGRTEIDSARSLGTLDFRVEVVDDLGSFPSDWLIRNER